MSFSSSKVYLIPSPFANVSSSRTIEVMPWTSTDPPPKRAKPKGLGMKPTESTAPTLLDKFVGNKKEEGDESGEENIIMNEDGTMYAASRAEQIP